MSIDTLGKRFNNIRFYNQNVGRYIRYYYKFIKYSIGIYYINY